MNIDKVTEIDGKSLMLMMIRDDAAWRFTMLIRVQWYYTKFKRATDTGVDVQTTDGNIVMNVKALVIGR